MDDENDGNGLGLALCRDILRSMDGWITVESVPNLGTTFTICLPV
jgi:signal transduction histidine kinase